LKSNLSEYLGSSIAFCTILACVLSCGNNGTKNQQPTRLNIVPTPNKVLTRAGVVTISNDLWVIVNVSDSISSNIAGVLVGKLEEITKSEVLITDLYSTRKHKQSISLEINETILDAETYSLDITSSQITLKAKTGAGLNYGIESLLQILNQSKSGHLFIIPKVVIRDFPRIKTRGVLINGNQLNDKATKDLLIKMAELKLNSLYIIGYTKSNLNLSQLALTYNIRVSGSAGLPDSSLILSVDSEKMKIEEIDFINENYEAVVLDISNSLPINSYRELKLLAELSWSKIEFDSIEALNQWIEDFYLLN